MESEEVRARTHATQRRLWVLLFVLLAGSLGVFLLHFFGLSEQVWTLYYRTYLVIALAHTWYVMGLLFVADVRPRTYPAYAGERIAVILPCFNEEPDLLAKSIHSIVHAKGNKEIVVIDDGSTKPELQALFPRLVAQYGIRMYSFEKNYGKRAALYVAVKHFLQTSQYVVMMDSDTVIDEDALVRIVEPLKLRKIGGASGDVRLLNENENRLTRMIGAYYWVALHIQRRAQSALGMVGCCSGALAAYKSRVLLPVIDDFIQSEFFGERSTHSEDRHLTNLVLRSGHDVVFVPTAVAYTSTPSTYRGFMRQQLRWRRGFFQEGMFTLTYALKRKPLLFFETLIWDLAMPFLSFGIVLMVLINMMLDFSLTFPCEDLKLYSCSLLAYTR
jgi:cellulose synthase/poly-beta-1,6-N-acetylglucosamine synthase-like glycosyltransferase